MPDNGMTRLKVADVVFREDLYPRIETNQVTVQKYAEDLSVLPAIEVNQHNELIDGWHRWTAHKKNEADDIACMVTQTSSDAELLELAIERNAKHGLQLSQDDKEDRARKIYSATPKKDRKAKKKRLAEILSVSEATITRWLSRIDKDEEAADKRAARAMAMACYTEREIATEIDRPQQTVNRWIEGLTQIEQLSDSGQTDASFAESFDAGGETQPGFEVPIYNVWKKQTKTPGVSHFGNSEVLWLHRLLYLYTHPFDVVIDPFAGSGSTIDACIKRSRRYLVSDLSPPDYSEGKTPPHKQIRRHDVTNGSGTANLLKPPQWKDVTLVYLDPPYWKQAEGQYGDSPSNLANMELEEFNATLSKLIMAFAKKLTAAHIALIIQPTQWNAPDKEFTDHVGDMLRLVKLPVDMRFSVPYESQQCTAQMVEWAKEMRRCLVLTREIIVWRAS